MQGWVNLTTNRMESCVMTSDLVATQIGESFEDMIERLAASAVDPEEGISMRETMQRDQVLQNFYNGKEEYHFEFHRRRENGTIEAPPQTPAETWNVIHCIPHSGCSFHSCTSRLPATSLPDT